MPSEKLLRSTILTSSWCSTATDSSCAVITKPPSPATHHTGSSGRANLAPMAAGSANPMVPEPPEFRNRPGRSSFHQSAAQIWFWPTSATTIASLWQRLYMSMSTSWGCRWPFECVYLSGCSSRHASICASQVPRLFSGCGRCGIIAFSACFASATSSICGRTFFPISEPSMSIWMKVFTFGAKSASFAVTRSSTRMPTIIKTSAFCTALRFQPVPMKPVMCSEHDRALRPGQRDRRGLGLIEVGMSVGLVSGDFQPLRRDVVGFGLLHVFADVDQHRSRTTGGRYVERLVDHARQLLDVGDEVAVLGDRAGGADDVGLLERISAHLRAGDLAGDRDHRHGVHVRGCKSRDQVQRAGA